MVSTREIIFACFWFSIEKFLKYLDFDQILGQTSVPHIACINKDEFGNFWVDSNSCGIALKLLIKVRMRQAASA